MCSRFVSRPSRVFCRDDVEKAFRHGSAPLSFGMLFLRMSIADEGKRFPRSSPVDGGVIEFVAAQQGAFRPGRMIRSQPRLPLSLGREPCRRNACQKRDDFSLAVAAGLF